MERVGRFLKEKAQFLYSIILIILIPVIIVANALWQIRTANENMTKVLESKAVLVESVLGDSINEGLNNHLALQDKISKVANKNPEISEITVMTQNVNDFTVIASSNKQNIGLRLTSEDYTSSWLQNKTTTKLFTDTTKTSPSRFWQVTSVLQNSSNKNVALVNMTLSLQNIDATNKKNLNTSIIILAVTIFLVLLLLINHFRFFEYTILFKRLKEVDKMKDDFISIATHEMKTPMAAIKGYISMMFEGLTGEYDQKTKLHLEKIYVNIQRLDLLLTETLDVSRLEQGRMQFNMQPCNISEIIQASISVLKDQADSKKITIKEIKVPNMPLVFVDPERLRQVCDNLIGNAIKYTPKGGITISYEIKNGKLNTIIKDTGIGMSRHDRNSLFTQFYCIKNEKTVDIPGTGLGLWIAREIIRKMNGKICVESTENVGSTFTIQLPYMEDK